jgi:hypothetical protein
MIQIKFCNELNHTSASLVKGCTNTSTDGFGGGYSNINTSIFKQKSRQVHQNTYCFLFTHDIITSMTRGSRQELAQNFGKYFGTNAL